MAPRRGTTLRAPVSRDREAKFDAVGVLLEGSGRLLHDGRLVGRHLCATDGAENPTGPDSLIRRLRASLTHLGDNVILERDAQLACPSETRDAQFRERLHHLRLRRLGRLGLGRVGLVLLGGRGLLDARGGFGDRVRLIVVLVVIRLWRLLRWRLATLKRLEQPDDLLLADLDRDVERRHLFVVHFLQRASHREEKFDNLI
mmetsp:Transcript_12299/g.25021  ORF Transcript_12299/g.25021 Transcript_12299/m.25021 type:complete len:201 (-) Transcript_12299:244-846(-)